MMKAKKPRHWAFATLRQLGVLAAVVAAVFFLNTQVLQVVYVPTGSMEPTLPSRSFAAGFRHPKDLKRYDIITFWQGDAVLVKRVIGLPGETIEVRDGHVYADGKRLKEDFCREPMETEEGTWEVPEDSYFVLGDNRNHSTDSRRFGAVRQDDVIAKLWK
ncbi:signal peptidase I [Drancourtella sp. An12]|uniref:signal peptidase I n=1 Tax=Drancourtella sp. An12 TaxID=1965548 RepID=UPI000B3935E6|nr:signal peptidase I [Drancourtella sp. An12]OUQ46286.1 signal peptidase I [Drancourtella sp. An12]